MEKSKLHVSKGIIYVILGILAVITIYPFWHVVMYSVSDPKEAMAGGLFFVPKGFSLVGFDSLFRSGQIFTAYKNSLFVTVVGTAVNVLMTASLAYPLSIRRFRGRKGVTLMVFFTMLFTGGMIPTYLLVDALNLLDSLWALIWPGAINAWNLIIMKNFFQSLPPSLEESASLDGASPIRILTHIVLPLSKPIIATMALFYGVVHWNAYFDAVLYIAPQSKQILPVYLRMLLNSTSMDQITSSGAVMDTAVVTEESMKMATIVASVLPVLIVYPFVQKYFVKGIMVGSIKE